MKKDGREIKKGLKIAAKYDGRILITPTASGGLRVEASYLDPKRKKRVNLKRVSDLADPYVEGCLRITVWNARTWLIEKTANLETPVTKKTRAVKMRKYTELPPERKEYRGDCPGGVATNYLKVSIPDAKKGTIYPSERRIEQFVYIKNRNKRAIEYLQAGLIVETSDGRGRWRRLDPDRYPIKSDDQRRKVPAVKELRTRLNTKKETT